MVPDIRSGAGNRHEPGPLLRRQAALAAVRTDNIDGASRMFHSFSVGALRANVCTGLLTVDKLLEAEKEALDGQMQRRTALNLDNTSSY